MRNLQILQHNREVVIYKNQVKTLRNQTGFSLRFARHLPELGFIAENSIPSKHPVNLYRFLCHRIKKINSQKLYAPLIPISDKKNYFNSSSKEKKRNNK